MQPANPPSAAPLDLDALERLAAETRDAWIAFSTAPNTHSGNDARVDYLHIREAFKNAVSPDVILALVAAARRGVEDTALREASGRAFDEIDINGASEDSARRARNILGPALTAYDRAVRAHPEDTTNAR